MENALGESNEVCEFPEHSGDEFLAFIKFFFQFFQRLKSLMNQLSTIRKDITSLPPVVIETDKIKERIEKIKVRYRALGKLNNLL